MKNVDSKLEQPIRRRKVIQAAAGASLLQLATPFIIPVRAADTVKIGLDNPLTGTYAAVGKNEMIGCQLAVEQINAKGGILGRQAELLVEDSTSGDAGTAVQKARKLIDRDKVSFLLGNVNSALTLAMAQVASEKGILHMVTGGHTDAVTGSSCHWNVFRICNTTQMEANAVTPSIIKNAGKKWYYITPDYAFGHTLQSGLEAACAKAGGTKLGADLTPLGTTDFSSYLIKAQAAKPDVILFLTQGDDMVNALKQAVQFGLDKRFHLAGAPAGARSRSRACRPRRASAPGSSSGTGTSRACRTSPSSSTRSRRRPAGCRRRAPGSASRRSGPARWRRTTPSRWRR